MTSTSTGLLALFLGAVIGFVLILGSMSRELTRISVKIDRGVAALQADAEAVHKLLGQRGAAE